MDGAAVPARRESREFGAGGLSSGGLAPWRAFAPLARQAGQPRIGNILPLLKAERSIKGIPIGPGSWQSILTAAVGRVWIMGGLECWSLANRHVQRGTNQTIIQEYPTGDERFP